MHSHHHHHGRRGAWRALAHPRGGRFGHFMHERGERGHHRGGGRVFDQGDLRWVILSLIADKPSHGYELIKTIEERLGGAYSPSPGVIYPTLTLLEDMGFLAPVGAEGSRRAFEITEAGRAALAENRATVSAILERMRRLAERSAGETAAPIVRAMENVRTALRLRLERGQPDPQTVARIAAALDDAAREIERD
jgi:DNA-binding PadR family transcriptional regulator